jgi:hypothetical protein
MSTRSTRRTNLAQPAITRLIRAFTLFLLLLPGSAWAQLTGTKTVPGTYATLAAAIADLNAQGVGAGGVTFNVAAGYTETFGLPTAGLITLNSSSPNAGSATRPIVFQKAGSGANPLITAGVGTGASDAIIAVAGTDYVSFTSIDVAENPANTTATTQMEAGYALYRATATDGSQYVQVTGATITLNRANTSSVGILSTSTTAAGAAVVTTSDVTSSNNYNKFNGNTVTNAFVGISVLGSSNFPDYNIEIGTTTGNVLSGLGGSDVSAYGIRCERQLGPKIENNTITILAGNLTTPVSGIRMDGLLIGAVLISNNTITITSATTGTVAGIWQASNATQSGTPSRTITNNKIQNCVLTGTGSGLVYYIREDTSWSNGGTAINGNQITGNTAATAGGVYGIYKTSSMQSLSVSGNTIANNVKSGESNPSVSVPAGFVGVYCVTGNFYGTYNNNIITNNQVMAANAAVFYGLYCAQYGSSDQDMTGNTVSGNQVQATNCQLYGIALGVGANNSSISGSSMNNNVLRNNTATLVGGTAAVYGLYCPAGGSRNDNMNGNTVVGLTIAGTGSTTNVLTGIYGYSTNFNARSISQNTVGDLALGGTGLSLSGTVKGVDMSFSGTCQRNKAYGLLAGGAAAKVYGLFINGPIDINNNLVGDLKAPNATDALAITGVYLSGNPTTNVFYNTVYLNASSTGNTFGTTALYVDGRVNNGGLVVRNNILVNTSTAAGAGGYTVAFRWVNSGGMPLLYSGDRNDLYAGQPSATNLLYVGGTATAGTITSVADPKQTLVDYKAFMASINREQGSVTELPPFLSTTGSSAAFLHINPNQYTQVSNAALPNSFYTTDYDSDLRSTTTPDIGADEFATPSTPSQDVGVTALVQPGPGSCTSCSLPVEVTIRNFGSSATTLPVPVQVVVTAPDGANQVLNGSYAGTLAVGSSVNFVVGNLVVASSYGFVAATTYSNDPVASNNAFSTSVTFAQSTLAPTVTSLSPATGPVGTSVTITGTNLSTTTDVRFNGTAASSFVVNPSGTSLTAVVALGTTTGPVSVTTPTGSATSVTSFVVRVAPTTVADAYSTPQGVLLTGNVLTNDIGTNPRAILIIRPTHGMLVLNPSGTFSYQPAAGYLGPDSFIYYACDPSEPLLCGNPATVSITVTRVAPITVADAYMTPVGVTLTGNVLTNDLGTNPRAILIIRPTHGVLVLNPDGSFSYQPAAGYVGPDSFIYYACNMGTPLVCGDPATVTITVGPTTSARSVATATKPSAATAGGTALALALTGTPNPFAEQLRLTFALPTTQAYTLAVYDAQGRLVQRLNSGQAEAGQAQQLDVPTASFATGLYLVRLTTATGVQLLKLIKQ